MFSVVFTMDGKKFSVEEFIRLSHWKVSNFWIRGKKMPLGSRISPSSGLKIDICEFQTFERKKNSIKKKIIAFIKNNQEIFNRLKTNKSVQYGIDIGFIEGWTGYFCLGTHLDSELLSILARNKVQLTFSVYFGGRKNGIRILT